MKRFLCMMLVFAIAFGCTGCAVVHRLKQRAEGVIEYLNTGHEYVDPEDVLIEQTYASLFAALDSGDADAILALFAENTRKTDKDMEAEVQRMLDRWPGKTELWYYDGISSGSYSTHYGVKTAEVTAMIPAFAGGETFFVLIDVVYRDDTDERSEGVNRMLFYTAEDLLRLRENPDFKYPSDDGLRVAVEETHDPHVVCIDQHPIRMADVDPLDPDEVAEFVQTDQSYSGFIERFGSPHGTDRLGLLNAYYWLPEENGEPRFLVLGITEWEDGIWGVYVKTALKTVDKLWYYKDPQSDTASNETT